MRALAALVAPLLALLSLQCAAAPFAVPVGDARIGLDAPPGFADTSFTGSPRLRDLAESQTSPSNRILMFAISDGDLRRFMDGDTPAFRRYMIAVTPKALEHQRLSRADFQRLVSETSQPPEGVEQLAELRSGEEVHCVLQRTRVPGGEDRPQYVLSTLTLLLLHGKAVNLSVYTLHDTPEDLAWIRAATARWIEQLRGLNGR